MSIAIGMMAGLVLYALGLDTIGIALMAAFGVIAAVIVFADWEGTKETWRRMHGKQ
jgi:hypothetical protein